MTDKAFNPVACDKGSKFEGFFKIQGSNGSCFIAKQGSGKNPTYFVWHVINTKGEIRTLDNNYTKSENKSKPSASTKENSAQAEALK